MAALLQGKTLEGFEDFEDGRRRIERDIGSAQSWPKTLQS
jgi:hypothetical protein